MLTNGNRKLGRDIYNFNLPRTTCVGRTPLCSKYCYAKGGFFAYPSVKHRMEQNLIESKQSDFVDRITSQIGKLKDVKYIRLHSSGDFYNNDYYSKWNQIAKNCPNVTFLAYTKNFSVDFSQRAPNFKIYYSIDESTTKFNKTLDLKAFVFGKGVYSNKHMNYVKDLSGFVCNGKCHECKFCFKSNKNVCFERR